MHVSRRTDDKLFRRLSTIYKDIAHSSDWVGGLGLVVTITLTLVTSNFKDALGLTAETWHTLFKIGDFLAFCNLFYALYYAFFRKVTIDDIIDTISS